MKNSLVTTLFKGTILNSPTRLEELARATSWMRRKPKKMKPIDFVHGILLAVCSGEFSYRALATSVGMRLDEFRSKFDSELKFDTISKQGIWKRVNHSAVEFMKATLAQLLKANGFTAHDIPKLQFIKRILVRDSTKIDLPKELSGQFPAGKGSKGKEAAGFRLQSVTDLIGGEAIQLELTEYYRQDQTAGTDILEVLLPGDLVLQDLGYLSSNLFNQIMENDAHFLSRYKHGTVLYRRSDEACGARLDLLKYLGKHAPKSGDSIDIDIVMGSAVSRNNSSQVKCRIVAVRLPDDVIEQRLRKVHAEEKRRGKMRSAESKKLFGWSIFITSLAREEVDVEVLLEIYPLRWRIEIIFKALKSYTPVKAISQHKSNEFHLQTLLYGWLCLAAAATKVGVFALAKKSSGEERNITPNLLSILKVMPKVLEMFRQALFYSSSRNPANLFDRWMTQCEYHDKYEKRTMRTNMAEMTAAALGFSDLDREISPQTLLLG